MLQDTNLVLNKFFSTLIFLFCGIFLSACAAPKKVPAFSPLLAKADQAIVYIYRPNKMTNAMYSPGLTIDGEFKLYVKNGINSQLVLAPGEHLFAFQNDNDYSELKPLSLIYKAGSTYFIRVDTSLKINHKTTYEPYLRSFHLTAIDEAQAVKEIAECCMNNNTETANKKTLTPSKKKAGNGFSVDKTQNPFSH